MNTTLEDHHTVEHNQDIFLLQVAYNTEQHSYAFEYLNQLLNSYKISKHTPDLKEVMLCCNVYQSQLHDDRVALNNLKKLYTSNIKKKLKSLVMVSNYAINIA